MIEWFKNHGWLPSAAAILILLGAPVAAKVSPKALRDLDIVQLSPTQLIGFIMVLIGVIFFAGALADVSKTSAKTLAAAEKSNAEALAKVGKASAGAIRRRESYEKIRTILDQHFALNEGDNNYYVSRVRRSANKLRDEMNEIASSATDTGEQALSRLISFQAGIFIRQLEFIERSSGINFDVRDDVSDTELSEEEKPFYLSAHKYWQDQTRAIEQGAAAMVGINDRD